MFGLPAGTTLAIIVLILGVVAAVVLPPSLGQAEVQRQRRQRSYRVGRSYEEEPPAERDRAAERKLRRQILLGTLGVAVVFVFIASFTYVPARTVAVPVTLGQPGKSFGSGVTLVSPFTRVEKFDAAVQTLELTNDSNADAPRVHVRLGNQTEGDVDVTRLAWNLNASGNISELYLQYRHFDKVEHNLVQGTAISAVQQVLATYDPLKGLGDPKSEQPKTTAQLQLDVQNAMTAALDARVGKDAVKIDSVQMYVHYDSTTQQKLNDFAKTKAETQVAAQQKLTNINIRDANTALAQGGAANKDPSVQYQNCLQLLRDLATRGQLKDLPINAVQCTLPGSQSGSSPLIVQPR